MPDPEMTPSDLPPPRRTPFEWSLAALRPMNSDAERPSFMYKAGRASRDREIWLWRWVAVGCLLLAVVVAVCGYGLIAAAEQRVAVAEARAAEARAAVVAARAESLSTAPIITPPVAGTSVDESFPPLVALEPMLKRPTWPTERATPDDQPTPREIARALDLRRSILIAGLGLIPDDKPGPYSPEPTDPPAGWPTPGGVFTFPDLRPRTPPLSIESAEFPPLDRE